MSFGASSFGGHPFGARRVSRNLPEMVTIGTVSGSSAGTLGQVRLQLAPEVRGQVLKLALPSEFSGSSSSLGQSVASARGANRRAAAAPQASGVYTADLQVGLSFDPTLQELPETGYLSAGLALQTRRGEVTLGIRHAREYFRVVATIFGEISWIRDLPLGLWSGRLRLRLRDGLLWFWADDELAANAVKIDLGFPAEPRLFARTASDEPSAIRVTWGQTVFRPVVLFGEVDAFDASYASSVAIDVIAPRQPSGDLSTPIYLHGADGAVTTSSTEYAYELTDKDRNKPVRNGRLTWKSTF